jgi:hypothetical protein
MLVRTPPKPNLVKPTGAPKMAPPGFFKAPDSPLDTAFDRLGPNKPTQKVMMGKKITAAIEDLQKQRDNLSGISASAQSRAMAIELEERIRAAGVYQMQKELEAMEGEADTDYVSEFRDFILGKSAYNTNKNKDVKPVPWGNRRLVGKDFDIYLNAIWDKRQQFETKIAGLKASGLAPSNIEDAWLYFMFVLKNPQDLNKMTEDMFLKPWDNFMPGELSPYIHKDPVTIPIDQMPDEIVPRLSTEPENKQAFEETQDKYSDTVRDTFALPPNPKEVTPDLIHLDGPATIDPIIPDPAIAPNTPPKTVTMQGVQPEPTPLGPTPGSQTAVPPPTPSPIDTLASIQTPEGGPRMTWAQARELMKTPEYAPGTKARSDLLKSVTRKIDFKEDDDKTDVADHRAQTLREEEETSPIVLDDDDDRTDPVMKYLSFSIRALEDIETDLDETGKKQIEQKKVFSKISALQAAIANNESEEIIRKHQVTVASLLTLVYMGQAQRTGGVDYTSSPFWKKAMTFQKMTQVA